MTCSSRYWSQIADRLRLANVHGARDGNNALNYFNPLTFGQVELSEIDGPAGARGGNFLAEQKGPSVTAGFLVLWGLLRPSGGKRRR